MELKRYQERVLREVESYLTALEEERARGNHTHGALDAWRKLRIPGNRYEERSNGVGEDLPSFCIKIPTGGGKTLLATHILGIAHRTLLKDRNGAGLALWVVPSEQIYRDTLAALRNREHPYRQTLEFTLARRVEVWQRHEIARLTPSQLGSQLNVLLVQLASTNRATKEQLRFFRDSGGNIVQHFPAEDALDEHRELRERVTNLDLVGGTLVATSVGNLVRMCRPVVILDEGHKATSTLARSTIEGMNPSLVIELSATPPADANVLVRVSGRELLDEEMIKLPINVANSNEATWQACLARACDKRKELAALARKHIPASGRLIRPMVLVQVERTGRDMRDGKHVHSEDVREHLVERLGIPRDNIAVKTAGTNEIENLDLLDAGCPIEWIITKAALQEGWDCPFAYVLVSLNASGSKKAMTQLVGRVLRQPDTRRTGVQGLDESYVFCLKSSATDVVREVKAALEREGYEGELESAVDRSDPDATRAKPIVARVRKEFRRQYVKPFEGRIFLPKFCVRANGDYEDLDYFRHLVARVDVESFDYGVVGGWDVRGELARAKSVYYRISLGSEERIREQGDHGGESDAQVQSWLVANLSFEHLSQKQIRAVVLQATARLLKSRGDLREKLALGKHLLLLKLAGLIEEQTDRQTEAAFVELFKKKRILFYLKCMECRFEIPSQVELRVVLPLFHPDGEPVQHSLLDKSGDVLNPYERDVALYLDRHPQVLWWYRNLVGPQHFAIQGYRKQRVYPDFVVQTAAERGRAGAKVLVLESKGPHLKGSGETEYKRALASYFSEAGKRVPWQKLAAGFAERRFRFQILDQGDYPGKEWQDRIESWLTG